MKKIFFILFLVFSLNCFSQKDTAITDSTPVISIRHLQAVSKYLEDKMIAKDYNVVMAVLNQVLQEAIIERKKKHK